MNNKKKWPGYVLSGFGIANILYALAGLWFLTPIVVRFQSIFGPDPEIPYHSQAFFTMATINITFLFGLIITGIYLLKRSLKIILFCNIIFSLELLYFFSIGFVGWGILGTGYPHVARSIAAATGIGNMGIVLQIITGYPIIGLIVLNIAKAKYRLAPPADNNRLKD